MDPINYYLPSSDPFAAFYSDLPRSILLPFFDSPLSLASFQTSDLLFTLDDYITIIGRPFLEP